MLARHRGDTVAGGRRGPWRLSLFFSVAGGGGRKGLRKRKEEDARGTVAFAAAGGGGRTGRTGRSSVLTPVGEERTGERDESGTCRRGLIGATVSLVLIQREQRCTVGS